MELDCLLAIHVEDSAFFGLCVCLCDVGALYLPIY